MKRTALAFALLLLFKGTVVSADSVRVEILTASATSSDPKSSPVECLLEPDCQGYWTPETRDSGTAEGIYIQLKKPVAVDFIDIHMKPNVDPKKTSLDCFLDGKEKSDEKTWFGVSLKKVSASEVVYRVQSITARPYREPKDKDIPLNALVRSMFIKLTRIVFKVGMDQKPCITKIILVEKGQPVQLQAIKTIGAAIHASSTLQPQTAYQSANLFDSRCDFAWSTDGKNSDGIGEKLEFKFENKLDLNGLMIWNGYQRSEVHYYSNGRVSKLCVESDVSAPQTIQIKDVNGEQTVSLPEPLKGAGKLTLRILSIYPGNHYKDVLISEMRLLDAENKAVNLLVKKERPRSDGELFKLLDTTLGSFGGFVTNRENGAIGFVDRTIRFRCNGSFVIYDMNKYWDEGMDDERPNYIYEGNWEEPESGIRIFGKKYSPSYETSQYLSGKEGFSYGIFQSPIAIRTYSSIPAAERIEILKQMLHAQLEPDVDKQKAVKWSTCLEKVDTPQSKITGKNYGDLLEKVDSYMMKKDVYYFSSDILKTLVFPFDENKTERNRW